MIFFAESRFSSDLRGLGGGGFPHKPHIPSVQDIIQDSHIVRAKFQAFPNRYCLQCLYFFAPSVALHPKGTICTTPLYIIQHRTALRRRAILLPFSMRAWGAARQLHVSASGGQFRSTYAH